MYNGERVIGEQLDALAAQQFDGDWELVLADNGSTDDTAALAQRSADRLPIRVIDVPTRGVSAARNAGVAITRHSKLAFLDQDDRAAPRWLAAMDRALDLFPLVGGRLDYVELNSPRIVAGRVQKPAVTELPTYRGVPHGFGCNMGCQRVTFETIGGFDPAFNSGADDVDFFFQAHLLGIEATFVDDAVVAYRLKPSLSEYRRQMYNYAVMDARLDAKNRRLGVILRQSSRSRAAAAWGHLKLLAGVNLWFTPVGRLQYAHRVGNAAGAFVGFVRYGQLVL
jgi:glycosyltransferase involved in cell wall biosynthesis